MVSWQLNKGSDREVEITDYILFLLNHVLALRKIVTLSAREPHEGHTKKADQDRQVKRPSALADRDGQHGGRC